jgi:selenocysteine lyase/cysteine desulfurase
VKRFEIAKPTDDAAAILNKINDAITSRTKVIFVSHITTDTGIILPIKEMASLAHSKGVISMVDGAHVPGMMPLNIKELGCDMYSASPHKWLQAPKGTGFLFIRDELIDRVWSTTTTAGWDDPKLRMERFQRFGSSNLPLLVGLKASLDFANQIGMNRIVKRHRELNRYITAEMNERGLTMWTSNNADMRCAISSFNMPPINIYDLERSLWKEHKIRVRGGGPNKIRLSTPYYLQKAEIDRFLERFDEFRKTYKA